MIANTPTINAGHVTTARDFNFRDKKGSAAEIKRKERREVEEQFKLCRELLLLKYDEFERRP